MTNPSNQQSSVVQQAIEQAVIFFGAAQGATQPVSFSVERDQLPALKAGFQQIHDKLEAARRKASQIPLTPSPGNDQVSVDTTHNLIAVANGDAGNFSWAMAKVLAVYQNLIDQTDTLIKNYNVTEQAAAHPFRNA